MKINIEKESDHTRIILAESQCFVSKYDGLRDTSKPEVDIEQLINIICTTIQAQPTTPVMISVKEKV